MIDDLVRKYSEPHRHYHVLTHPVHMIERAHKFELSLSNELIWAIMCHDVVYDIPADPGDNERESAEFCAWCMEEMGYPDESVERATALIEATAKVLEPGVPDLTDEQWVICGLDLWELATNYDCNAADIRREFAFLSYPEYAKTRIAFLNILRNKEFIISPVFFTKGHVDLSFRRWHRIAAENIQSEITSLESFDSKHHED